MQKKRDRPHKTSCEDIVSIVLTVAIVIMSLGFFVTLFDFNNSGNLADNSHTSSDADKNTNNGTETDTENDNDNDADTDTDSKNLLYDFNSNFVEGITYSANVDAYDYLTVDVVKDSKTNSSVLAVEKSAYSASSEVVWLALPENGYDDTYVFETDFMWSGCKNGVSGETDPTWYYRLSLSNTSGVENIDFLNLWFCSQTGENAFAIVGSTSATVNDYLTILNTNQWYRLTIEYNSQTNNALVFIDGNAIGFVSSVAPNADDVCGAFEIENRGKVRDSIIYFDNVSYVVCDTYE